jgi:hypothetical protein
MTPSNALIPLALTALCAALLPNLAHAATPQPGKVFKDCKDCPEMVVLPPGHSPWARPKTKSAANPTKARCMP